MTAPTISVPTNIATLLESEAPVIPIDSVEMTNSDITSSEVTYSEPDPAWSALNQPCPTCGGDPGDEDHPCRYSKADHGSHCDCSMEHDVCHWCGIEWMGDGEYKCPDCPDGRMWFTITTPCPTDHIVHYRSCNCLGDSASCCASNCENGEASVGVFSIQHIIPVVPFANIDDQEDALEWAVVVTEDGAAFLCPPITDAPPELIPGEFVPGGFAVVLNRKETP